MKLVYTKKGEEPQRFDFDPMDLESPDVEALEQHSGLTFMEWGEKLSKGSFVAMHGLLFVLLRQNNPSVRWDDVVFTMGELDFEEDETETVPKDEAPAVSSVKSGPRRSLAS